MERRKKGGIRHVRELHKHRKVLQIPTALRLVCYIGLTLEATHVANLLRDPA